MPRQIKISRIKDRMPVRYRLHPVNIGIKVVFALAVAIYASYFAAKMVSQDSPIFFKIVALLLIYVGIDSTIRHLSTLSSVYFTPECLWLRFPLKPSIPILWENLISMQLQKKITYYIYIEYKDLKGRNRIFKTPASFPKMTEILYNIADIAPQQIKMNLELEKMVEVLRAFADQETND